jgi:hypothetical protein
MNIQRTLGLRCGALLPEARTWAAMAALSVCLTVPLPAALPLLLCGFGVLAVGRSRRGRSADFPPFARFAAVQGD